MGILRIEDLGIDQLQVYRALTDREMLSATEESGEKQIVVESPKVIWRAIEAGFRPLSLLCEEKHISGDAADIIAKFPDMPVYTAPRDVLKSLTGYTLTRGVLCAVKRPALPRVEDILKDTGRVCVVYDVCDATNVGVIFRTAAALGFDAVLVSPKSCSPLNRRAVRVSMGAVFQIPWTETDDIMPVLADYGFRRIGMALRKESVTMHDYKTKKNDKYAILLGSEGYGLPGEVIDECDDVVKIPMSHGVDSLNVGAAAAIALWHFSR